MQLGRWSYVTVAVDGGIDQRTADHLADQLAINAVI